MTTQLMLAQPCQAFTCQHKPAHQGTHVVLMRQVCKRVYDIVFGEPEADTGQHRSTTCLSCGATSMGYPCYDCGSKHVRNSHGTGDWRND